MTILDAKLMFSTGQAITTLADAASEISDYVADLGTGMKDAWGNAITPDIGEGGELEVNSVVSVVMVNASATIEVQLVTKAADATLTSGGTQLGVKVFPAESVAGTRLSFHVPSGAVLRYLGVIYKAVGAELTSGTFITWLGMDHEKYD